MKNIKELYSAQARYPKGNEDIIFAYSQMEIKRRYDTMLEMKHSYFTSSTYSTHYFDSSMLEKEYRITDELKVFYSASKEKCIEWLNKERDAAIERCKRDLQRLEKTEIKEEAE